MSAVNLINRSRDQSLQEDNDAVIGAATSCFSDEIPQVRWDAAALREYSKWDFISAIENDNG